MSSTALTGFLFLLCEVLIQFARCAVFWGVNGVQFNRREKNMPEIPIRYSLISMYMKSSNTPAAKGKI